MLSFSPIETSFKSEDKGCNYSSSLDDPYNDLFDQYIRHDSSSPNDTGNRSNGFEFIEFPPIDDDTTSSGSNVGDHLFNSINSPTTARPQRQANLRFTQSLEILPSQAYRRFPRLETPKAAISGAELLNLEGKRELPTRPYPDPSLTAPAPPPLRRKTRFSTSSPETLRHKNHKVSKSPGIGTGDPSKMMRSSYYYRHETPSFNDCTQQLEQFSLYAPFHGLPMSPPPPEALFPEEKPGADVRLASGSAHNRGAQSEDRDSSFTHVRGDLPEIAEFNTDPSPVTYPHLEAPKPRHPAVAIDGLRESRSQTMAEDTKIPMPAEQPSSWKQATASTDNFEFMISPSDIPSDWAPIFLDHNDIYYQNVGASQSAPALAHSSEDTSGPGLIMPSNPFDPFIAEVPSHNHPVGPTDPFPSSDVSMYPPVVSPTVRTGRARTPSSRASSPCPSPSATSKSPSKQRRRSKSSRRKGSAAALRAPTTTMGFVNFTPNDSQKLLTGVAPSGSSKTKARREQEASENKRRLSQVAEKLFVESGGDLEKLRATGLFA